MTEEKFHQQLDLISALPFREDAEPLVYDLYKSATNDQRHNMRHLYITNQLHTAKPWKNPADYDRDDLTREQKMRRSLFELSLRGGSDDFRDDLVNIAYCYHNLQLLNINANLFLKSLAYMSDPNFASTVFNFVERTPDEKDLKNWGLKIVQTPTGPQAHYFLSPFSPSPKRP